jgi:hypothetical protein
MNELTSYKSLEHKAYDSSPLLRVHLTSGINISGLIMWVIRWCGMTAKLHQSCYVAETLEFRRLFTWLPLSYENQRRKMVYIILISYRGSEFVILSWISVASQLIFNFCAKMEKVLRKGCSCTLIYTYVVRVRPKYNSMLKLSTNWNAGSGGNVSSYCHEIAVVCKLEFRSKLW